MSIDRGKKSKKPLPTWEDNLENTFVSWGKPSHSERTVWAFVFPSPDVSFPCLSKSCYLRNCVLFVLLYVPVPYRMKWHVKLLNWLSLTSSLLPFPNYSKLFFMEMQCMALMLRSSHQLPSVSSSWIPSTWVVLDVSVCACGYSLKPTWDPRPGTELPALSCKLLL